LKKNLLAGKKILITRAREQSGHSATLLKKLGAEVIEFPTIEIVPPTTWRGFDRAIDQLKSYDWIIFTSANGVNFFFERLREKGRDCYMPSSVKVCAIGPATASQLKDKGIRVDYVPKEFVAEAILKGFKEMVVKGRRILLARAKEARDVLPQGLRKIGAEVDVVVVYQTVKPKGGSRRLKKLLRDGGIDVITFTSSSTVNHFAELLKKEDLKKLLDGIAIACIGPITARTAKKWEMRVQILPKQYTIPALTRSIAEYFAKRNLSPHPSPLPRGERAG
jgi:uroporphyrinogen III methyltransferase / synthase